MSGSTKIAPRPVRCPSKDVTEKPKRPLSTYTHKCHQEVSHFGNCSCICGHNWKKKVHA